jgi:polyhydroxyalkanoate synthesis regulator phasin
VSAEEAKRVLEDLRRKVAARDSADAQVRQAIVEAMKLRGVSRQEMAEIANLSVPRLYQIRDGRR